MGLTVVAFVPHPLKKKPLKFQMCAAGFNVCFRALRNARSLSKMQLTFEQPVRLAPLSVNFNEYTFLQMPSRSLYATKELEM